MLQYIKLPRGINNIRFASAYSNISCKEVRIPVPWGHLAGKWWGPKNKRPILTLHGWQDNCGSFDLLIPRLPKHMSFLAFDFPGHGHSSRLPPGMFYLDLDATILLRSLQHYFQWEKLSLMGHSLGARTIFTFAGLFPNSVDFLVCIDGLHLLINPKRLDRVTQSIDAFLKYDAHAQSSTEPPAYSLEAMIDMMHLGTKESIAKDKCKYILERNAKESKARPGMYYFNRDPRLKSGPLMNWPREDLLEHARRVDCALFATKSLKNPIRSNATLYEIVKDILLEKPGREFHNLKDTHHGHLNAPEMYEGILSRFLKKYYCGERDIDVNVFERIRF